MISFNFIKMFSDVPQVAIYFSNIGLEYRISVLEIRIDFLLAWHVWNSQRQGGPYLKFVLSFYRSASNQ